MRNQNLKLIFRAMILLLKSMCCIESEKAKSRVYKLKTLLYPTYPFLYPAGELPWQCGRFSEKDSPRSPCPISMIVRTVENL